MYGQWYTLLREGRIVERNVRDAGGRNDRRPFANQRSQQAMQAAEAATTSQQLERCKCAADGERGGRGRSGVDAAGGRSDGIVVHECRCQDEGDESAATAVEPKPGNVNCLQGEERDRYEECDAYGNATFSDDRCEDERVKNRQSRPERADREQRKASGRTVGGLRHLHAGRGVGAPADSAAGDPRFQTNTIGLAPSVKRHRAAFTLVELLVVLGVIATLLAILLPALSGARRSALMTSEMVGARDLMLAWSVYADDNNDAVLPGYRTGLPAADLQGESLEFAYGGIIAARYPWRIIPYLGYEMRALYRDDHEALLEALEQRDRAEFNYFVSVSPALGINATWVGGDQTELGFNPVQIQNYGTFYVSRRSQAFHPERLMVFTSARGLDPSFQTKNVEGYFKVTSPRLTAGGEPRWGGPWRASAPPDEFGQVSLRHSGKAVAGFVDGHVDTLDERAITDMRHWANRAMDRDYGLEPIDG